MSTTPVRLRFAPSPTGFLHIGGVRAALFNYLYAKRHGGQFLLRIEDTDLERSESRYTQDILASMKWLGLDWDEEPIYQSSRLDVYRERALELVASGHAYYCTCTEADVEKMREVAIAAGKKPQYDRRCRGTSKIPPAGQPYVIRAAIPLEGHVKFEDLIRGSIRVENSEIDDFVLIRSNGAPTYNLSVVVDDVFSQMTHIVRGDDHINNTPKQIHLYDYFGYPLPKFAHLPMILGADKKKLSKRHGAVSANLYRADGFLPEALLNFLARLGWSHGDQEIFSRAEMIEFFSFDHVQKSSAVFNSEKLLWLNGEHLRHVPASRLASIIQEDYPDHFKEPALVGEIQSEMGVQLVSLIQPKVKLVKDIASQLVPLCTPGTVEVDSSELKWNKDPALKAATQGAIEHLVAEFSKKVGTAQKLADVGLGHSEIEALIRQVSEQHGVKLGDLVQPMRLTVTGRMVSAGLFDLLAILPWARVKPRLEKARIL